jgi:hypothetical protein
LDFNAGPDVGGETIIELSVGRLYGGEVDRSTVGTVVNAVMFAGDIVAIAYSLYWASRDRRSPHRRLSQPILGRYTSESQEV